MGSHDDYGKQVMRRMAGPAFQGWGQSVEVDYKSGRPARIDGTVKEQVAVEIESRVAKQIRGALLDLICHRYPKKLLVLLPVHMNDVSVTAAQCRFILERFLPPADFRVAVLLGTGEVQRFDADVPILRAALTELGVELGPF
jgi:hypothetical protein